MEPASRHILEEDVVPELQRLLGLRCPVRGLRHSGRVIVRGAAGGIWHLAVDYLVSGDPRLGQLTKRDRLRATQVGIVRSFMFQQLNWYGFWHTQTAVSSATCTTTPRTWSNAGR